MNEKVSTLLEQPDKKDKERNTAIKIFFIINSSLL
jgi:hypothetical protein